MADDRKIIPESVSKEELIKIKAGKHFAPQVRMAAYLSGFFAFFFIVAGFVFEMDEAQMGQYAIAVAVLSVSILVIIAPSGIQLDPTNRSYRYYPFIFSLKSGWRSLEIYTDITILSRNITQSMHSARTIGNSVSHTDKYHDICVLIKSHRKKMLIKRFKNYEEARAELPQFAEKLGLVISKYNPEISEKTKARKRNRR